MNILIAGASGFIGKELVKSLSSSHQITVLGRDLDKLHCLFSKEINKITWASLGTLDATQYDLVINLSGSNIGERRWNDAVKKELITSRTLSNQQLITWLMSQNAKPRFFCANAIGIYGAEEERIASFDEDAVLPESSEDFLQQIGLLWQNSLNAAIEAGIPVTTMRFGVVLKKGQGMLKKLELPFRLGLGSIIGSGQQIISWIDSEDLVYAIHFLIEHPSLTGPVNLTSPIPVAQKDFAQHYAHILKRPLFLRMPSWLVSILFGEMGDYLLLKGQKVLPKRLTEMGFIFAYPEIQDALNKEYGIHKSAKITQ